MAIDELLFLDRSFVEGKGKILRRNVVHGGNVATALVAITTLGGSARWLGYLSPGESAHDLARHGVDLDHATPAKTGPIRSTIMIAPGGDRFIAFDDDVPLGMPEQGANLQTLLGGVDALLVDAYAAAHGLPLVRAAAAAGIAVVADIERLDFPHAEELFDIAAHLVIPLEVGQKVTGLTDELAICQGLWNKHRTAVVVTDGSRGAWHLTADGAAHTAAFTVEAVDTSGCGDVFHGAYALSVAGGSSIAHAVLTASAAAAVCATAAGGRGHLPTPADVAALIDAAALLATDLQLNTHARNPHTNP
ncbi:PfkB family carbohydrate kinase [Microbacterium sp. 5K110]|uniref:PfkB family carbohydrate kinase n=1 Tax=unclassified Microbacterium TaxID=2609290 RepID=UPI0014850708|nr:PfkB family carbohydrate kinase [Microbacterium sp. 5K110]